MRLDFVRGPVPVAAIDEHALYTHADKFDVGEVVMTVAAVRDLLAGADLARARPVTAFGRAWVSHAV
ncbi:hypothetical protein [Nocardioides sp. InS609-2]|uniref:hypothetical protein n=1 Tax=Nocardioides sp. InS609-2 TaxID=2760705 RepID=UPI0020C0DB20|nr:hypothetical protein [Nocardioides sp. InS609-2]